MPADLSPKFILQDDIGFWACGAFIRPRPDLLYLYSTVGGRESDLGVEVMDFFDGEVSRFGKLGKIFQGPPDTMVETAIFEKGCLLGKKQFSPLSRESFATSFAWAQNQFKKNLLRKVVPTVAAHAEFPNAGLSSQIRRWMQATLKAPPSLIPFGFWNEKSGVLGATPEILFHRSGKVVKTMALAGTLPKRSDLTTQDIQDFLQDPKELQEHNFVIEDLSMQLAQFGKIKRGPTTVLELPTLFHLHTPLELQIEAENYSDLALMKSLHPTPALGCFPRQKNPEIMLQMPEQKERRSFGAPVLFQLSPSESICLVMIRNIQWQKNSAKIHVGCGLVAASQEEKEWTELQQKLESVFKILEIS